MATLVHLLTALVILCGFSQTSACSCAPPGTICDSVQRVDAVVHVRPISRADGADINDDAVYTLETLEVFKAEEPGPNEYDQVGVRFSMTTAGNSGLCGVNMQLTGTEYLVDMNRDSDGNLRAAGICGLFREWSEEDRETLEAGCDDYDPCDGECGEFQECVRSLDLYEADYYCSDTCDPSPCQEDEACILDFPDCAYGDGGPCIGEATCGGETEGPASFSPTPAPGDDSFETTGPTSSVPADGDADVVTPAPGGGTRDGPGDDDVTPSPAAGGSVPGGSPSAAPVTPAPTSGVDAATPSPSTSSSGGSRGISTSDSTEAPTGAPSMSPTAIGDRAAPLPEESPAPTSGTGTGTEGDSTSAATTATTFGLSGGLVAATAAAAIACVLL